ncbi:beta-galactosidase 13-like protein, partial [Tanacetum coccineum]
CHDETNFGRTSSSFVTTRYDEALLDEFDPKWSYLRDLHKTLDMVKASTEFDYDGGMSFPSGVYAHAEKRSKSLEQRADTMGRDDALRSLANALDQWADEYLRKADAYG